MKQSAAVNIDTLNDDDGFSASKTQRD